MEVLTLEPPHAGNSRRDVSAEPYCSVAIGAFDGVHLGHGEVVAGCDTVLTFDPHPMSVLAPQHTPSLLSDHRTKMRKLAALGVQRVAIIPFDDFWARVSPEAFVERVLIDSLHAKFVSVGENFRFGARGAGTPDTFLDYPSLEVRVVPMVKWGAAGDPISSTRIRRNVAAGNVESAAELLGGPLVLPARVSDAGHLVVADEYALPAPGLYLGRVDNRSVSLRVRPGGIMTATGILRPGTSVWVSFESRGA